MTDLYVTTAAPPGTLRADAQRRTITGQVVPWGVYATVSTGQTVAFARGGLTLSERAKLVLDHDPAKPVAVYVTSTDTDTGLEATFRVPAGPAGDEILAQAGEGLRDGLSVGADITAADERDDGLWVTAARGRHVALLSEPAFDTARVSAVVATAPPVITTTTLGDAMSNQTVTASAPPEPEPEPETPDPAVTLTAAAAAPAPAAPARVRDPYPYARPHIAGGPSFVRDAWESMENPGSEGAERWRRMLAMNADPAHVRDALARFGAGPVDVAAATGTTTGLSDLVPPRWAPERYVSIRAIKSPLWSVLTKYATPDFTNIMVPRTADESGLAGPPADEVTPIAPGTIDVSVDTVTINEIEGSYQFSRKLLMGSNPQIDTIALDAMERAWQTDVEDLAVAFFLQPANHTAVSATYTDAPTYLTALLTEFANMATSPFTPTDVVPAQAEYRALATATDTTGRPLLPYGPRMNAPGESEAGYAGLVLQGVPLYPGQSMTAKNTLVLDQSASSAAAFSTPVMNFRLEWTNATGNIGNVKVLQLTKYSGVGFWAQHPEGVVAITNTGALPLEADGGPARARGAAKKA